jgi:hypothetical protein
MARKPHASVEGCWDIVLDRDKLCAEKLRTRGCTQSVLLLDSRWENKRNKHRAVDFRFDVTMHKDTFLQTIWARSNIRN